MTISCRRYNTPKIQYLTTSSLQCREFDSAQLAQWAGSHILQYLIATVSRIRSGLVPQWVGSHTRQTFGIDSLGHVRIFSSPAHVSCHMKPCPLNVGNVVRSMIFSKSMEQGGYIASSCTKFKWNVYQILTK